MPEEADPPEVSKVESDSDPILWLNMRSANMDHAAAVRLRRPLRGRSPLQPGRRGAGALGGSQRYAMRIWLDREASWPRAD
jgi:multidrug efflux pump